MLARARQYSDIGVLFFFISFISNIANSITQNALVFRNKLAFCE